MYLTTIKQNKKKCMYIFKVLTYFVIPVSQENVQLVLPVGREMIVTSLIKINSSQFQFAFTLLLVRFNIFAHTYSLDFSICELMFFVHFSIDILIISKILF